MIKGPERDRNHFSLTLNGQTLIGKNMPTMDGRFIGPNQAGVFKTEHAGVILVDFSVQTRENPYEVLVAGKILKRPHRSLRDLNHHFAATTGTHRINVGRKAHGAADIGKDPKTGEARRLELEYKPEPFSASKA